MSKRDTDGRSEFDQGVARLRTGFDPGEKLTGTVTAITKSCVFVDISSRSDGILERSEVERDGQLTVAVGDQIEVFFSGMKKGEMVLTRGLRGGEIDDDALYQAYSSHIPLDGLVTGERKGGFEVKVGNATAFCPYSLMDLHRAPSAQVYLGQHLRFVVIEYEEGGGAVLSRRALLEEEAAQRREQLKATLKENDIIEGTVTRLVDFGAFVDLGGMDGLIPMGELSWTRIKTADEVVKVGDRVSVRVNRLDWEHDRISLSLRKAQGDPWETVEEKYQRGGAYPGVVVKLMDFGAFVALEPGVEGLIPISRLGSGRRLGHAGEVLKEGQEVMVVVENVEIERHRISLDLPPARAPEAAEPGAPAPPTVELKVGAEVTGTVADIRQFGVFINLGGGHTGLLHISELNLESSPNRGRAMYKRFPPGSSVTVLIKSIDGDRYSLALPESQGDPEDDYRAHLKKEGEGEALGNLGGLFDQLKL